MIFVALLPISQPAVSKHLRLLREAGMVRVTVDAQRRLYSLAPEAFRRHRVLPQAPFRAFWADRMDALETHLDQGSPDAMLDGQTLARFRALKLGTELTLTRRYRQPAAKAVRRSYHPRADRELWMGVTWMGDSCSPGAWDRATLTGSPTPTWPAKGGSSALEPGAPDRTHLVREHTARLHASSGGLDPDREGCTLTLTQTSLRPLRTAPRNGAGWTMLIGQLDAWLAGATFAPAQSWRSLRDRYAEEMGPRAARDGRRFEKDGRPVVQFERVIDLPIPETWAWLTKPEKLARWLGAVEVDLKPGGDFRIGSGTDPAWMNGTIVEVRPPRRLSMIWREPWFTTDEVRLTFDLEDLDGATLLTLTHVFPAGYDPHEYAPGWHEFLDRLDGAIEGRSAPDWSSPEASRPWEKLKAIYAAIEGAEG